MSDLAAVNRRRKHLRKWMLIAIIPVAIAILLYGVKVVSMTAFAETTLKTYTNGDLTTAQQSASRLKFANWFEPWKAYFDNGTTMVALGSYDLAVPELDEARARYESGKDLKAKEIKEVSCKIRGNLAIAYEGLGDNQITDKKIDEAQKSYDSAKSIIKDCDDENNSDTKERLDTKSSGEAQEQPAEPEPTQEEVDAIQEQLDANNEERQDDESSDASNTSGDYTDEDGDQNSPEPVDKPW